MDPALREGDSIFARSRILGGDVRRGQIVFFTRDSKPFQVKRVVGLPGETLWMMQGIVFADGKRVGFYNELKDLSPEQLSFEPVVVPPKHYFLIGDNLGESVDSRHYCSVSAERVLYTAMFIYRPFARFKFFWY